MIRNNAARNQLFLKKVLVVRNIFIIFAVERKNRISIYKTIYAYSDLYIDL